MSVGCDYKGCYGDCYFYSGTLLGSRMRGIRLGEGAARLMDGCVFGADRGADGEGGAECPGDGGLPGDRERLAHGGLHRHERRLVPLTRHLHHHPGAACRRGQVGTE